MLKHVLSRENVYERHRGPEKRAWKESIQKLWLSFHIDHSFQNCFIELPPAFCAANREENLGGLC